MPGAMEHPFGGNSLLYSLPRLDMVGYVLMPSHECCTISCFYAAPPPHFQGTTVELESRLQQNLDPVFCISDVGSCWLEIAAAAATTDDDDDEAS